jgi:cytochrome c biogenesis protein
MWKFLCSVKLTIVLLLSLALTSILGTFIPQNQSPDAYVQAFGPFLYRFFSVLGILDMYHSWWFQGLLVLLAANIVVCSIDRLQSNWKLIFNRNPKVRPKRFTKRSNAKSLTDKRPPQTLAEEYEPILAKRYPKVKVEKTNTGAVLYGEKGRWSRLGVYIVHLSVLFLLIGGLVGSFFGFEGFVNIPEGETTDTIRIRNTGRIHRLDFQIRCDDFSMTLYETGAPKEYRSSLSILENDSVVKQKDIIVNDPLRYKGINIFQSSYGKLPPDQMPRSKAPQPGPKDSYTLNVLSKESGMSYALTANVGEPVDIPEGLGKFVVMAYEKEAQFRGMDVGAALKGVLTPPGSEAVEVLLPLKFANFDKMRGGRVIISVSDQKQETFSPQTPAEERYYTGLQVTNDPGVWFVYTGFILMITGCFVTFFLSHQQVCIVIEQLAKNCRVTLAGVTNRNPLSMNNTIENLFSDLSKR